jgi:NADH:ubiquinone oxidoreductase subunit E
LDRDEIKEILGRFPRHRTYLLPTLRAVQEELHWLPAWAMEEIGVYLRVPKSEVHGVASSFPELRLKEPGRHVLRVCTGLACYLKGAPQVLEAVSGALEIGVGETTEDGILTLEEAQCLFVCAMAPTMDLDGAPFGKLTPEDAVTRLQAVPRNMPLQR